MSTGPASVGTTTAGTPSTRPSRPIGSSTCPKPSIQLRRAGVAAVTAWRALIDHASLEPGETCLVHGGSGGVGHAAVQLAAATGAHVLTTAAPECHDPLHELGADAVFDYARDDLADAVHEGSTARAGAAGDGST